MFVELKMFTKFNIYVVYLVACKYEEIQKIINVLSCLGNLIVARTMCLSYYCIAMEVIKGFPSLPVLDKQFLVM